MNNFSNFFSFPHDGYSEDCLPKLSRVVIYDPHRFDIPLAVSPDLFQQKTTPIPSSYNQQAQAMLRKRKHRLPHRAQQGAAPPHERKENHEINCEHSSGKAFKPIDPQNQQTGGNRSDEGYADESRDPLKVDI